VIHYKGESTVKDYLHETVSGIYAVFQKHSQGFSILFGFMKTGILFFFENVSGSTKEKDT
jgi:hypothetical protein